MTEDALSPDDPYVRQAQTYPTLASDKVARLCRFGDRRTCRAGDMLFRRGDRGASFFLILSGGCETFDETDRGEARRLTLHGAGQFTGELDLFNDRKTLVSARMVEDGEVLAVPRQKFRQLIQAEPDIGEIIMRAFILRRVGMMRHRRGGVVLIGPGRAADTLRIQRFLSRNGYPFRLLDTDVDPDAEGFLDCFALGADDLPVVIAERTPLKNPANPHLAAALGLVEPLDADHVWDVVVVGAGPAGLAASVYAASEGLKVLTLETHAPGGQAGTSSKIENYLGFPTGISGQALAGRAQVQAQKFGAHLAIAREAVSLDCEAVPYSIGLATGEAVRTQAVILAPGARYRRLALEGYDRFEGAGIHYAATNMEAELCAGEEVVVVGGGNSAGQAAIFLARLARHVHIAVRSGGLAASMSDYLVQRIDAAPNITLHTHTEVCRLAGGDGLEEVALTNGDGVVRTLACRNLFVMIGAVPNTDWLDGCLPLDERGFILTGKCGRGTNLDSPYATSRPGIFAVGDVRSGSVKRVASGVGEGSVVVQAVHRFLSPADIAS
ncbi:FAD-dependent oxidoreductase [Pacificimonas flava]|uniref:Thioredoxin reductase n=1 Tax=Pacificimonas flava TaxID=1234595 RepID=M2TAT5_9SPHN|nr:FAD-dependent oxidoreductase [Pacificimonas flava]EMD83709.1 Thioredoxin reductase [Pacificimonas flava]MBB5280609.1 thioredoxin reductase (NADPH) [Pacificimonas flava]